MSERRVDPRALLAVTLRKFFNFVGYAGALLIMYSVISELTGEKWKFVETWAPPASSAITILGTLLTAASVYFYNAAPSPPERFSLYVSAPIVIVACAVALYFLFRLGDVPVVVVNGFAMLGLSGAWFRMQPNPGIY